MIERTFSYDKVGTFKAYAAALGLFLLLHHRKSWLLKLERVGYLGLGFAALISYPLYVIHPEPNLALRRYFGDFGTYDPVVWCLVIFGICYAVHRLVELPGIQLGKRLR